MKLHIYLKILKALTDSSLLLSLYFTLYDDSNTSVALICFLLNPSMWQNLSAHKYYCDTEYQPA